MENTFKHTKVKEKTFTIAVIITILIVVIEYSGIFVVHLPGMKGAPISLGLLAFMLLYVLAKEKVVEIFSYKPVIYLLIFIFLTFLAIFHSFLAREAINIFKGQVGYLFLTVVIAFSLTSIKKLEAFALAFLLIHFFNIAYNTEVVFSGVRMGFIKAGYFLGDGNDFSWALVSAFPLALFLVLDKNKPKIKRLVGLGLLGVLLFSVLWMQSRGATLAMIGAFTYYWFYISKTKARTAIVILFIAVIGVSVAPSSYFSRMQTISSYEEDTSAMGRIKAWGAAFRMAVDHPILGVGAGSFNSVYGRKYRSSTDPVRWISTHSVYFKLLAEYSFFGVFIYLSILYQTFKLNLSMRKTLYENGDRLEIFKLWPDILNMVLIAYSIAATFLTGFEYPHLFLIIGMSIAMDRIIKSEMNSIGQQDDVQSVGDGASIDNKKFY